MRSATPPEFRSGLLSGGVAVHIPALRIIWESPGRAGGLPNELKRPSYFSGPALSTPTSNMTLNNSLEWHVLR